MKAERAGGAGGGRGCAGGAVLQPQKEMLARSSEQGCLAGGDAAGFNSRNTSHLSYCKIDVCLDAENALDPFFPPLAGMKSLKQNKMLLIPRLFWAPVADCLLPRPSAHAAFSKKGFNKPK